MIDLVSNKKLLSYRKRKRQSYFWIPFAQPTKFVWIAKCRVRWPRLAGLRYLREEGGLVKGGLWQRVREHLLTQYLWPFWLSLTNTIRSNLTNTIRSQSKYQLMVRRADSWQRVRERLLTQDPSSHFLKAVLSLLAKLQSQLQAMRRKSLNRRRFQWWEWKVFWLDISHSCPISIFSEESWQKGLLLLPCPIIALLPILSLPPISSLPLSLPFLQETGTQCDTLLHFDAKHTHCCD